jgi:tetratricopeptide (TPR) repeat protein
MTALLLALALLSAPPVSADPLLGRLDRAVVQGSVEALEELRSEVLPRVEGGDPSPSDRYLLAYLNWRIQQLPGMSQEQKKIYLKEAQAQLELLLEARPDDAEVHALRGSAIGERITGGFSSMFLGPRASGALQRAYELGPENPRVALQRGISYFFTPKAFGGGVERSEAELRRARELFAAEDAGRPWPNWGRLDCLAWLGQVLASQGQTEEARVLYQEALKLEPEYDWVRHALLPALDRPSD